MGPLKHTAQILGHLQPSRLEHGLLVNFGSPRTRFRQFILRVED